jgi:flavin reductase (DIM6/NTAB) family NADH-FMN oxidoreductase RutF
MNIEYAGLTKEASKLVEPWRVKESPIQFECKSYTTLHLPGASVMGNVDIIIGRVIGVHIQSWALNEHGMIGSIFQRSAYRDRTVRILSKYSCRTCTPQTAYLRG